MADRLDPFSAACSVHCPSCEGQDHHWGRFGQVDESGDPVVSCRHCETLRPSGTTSSEARTASVALKAADGPWLIRSHYHGAWHRRGSDGGAQGYTNDITQAGIFELPKAQEYHHPGDRDTAVPLSSVIPGLEARLSELTAARDALAAAVERARASLRQPDHPNP